MRKKGKSMKKFKILSSILAIAMIAASVPVMGAETGTYSFTSVGGGFESLYATIGSVTDSQVTGVSYSGSMSGSLQGEDFEYLVRDVDTDGDGTKDAVRVDIPGLKSGSYTLTVTADGKEYTKEDISVMAYDRAGFAHYNYSEAIGAYNNNGTLKKNAKVLYVTDENKNTVTLEISGNSVTGIGNILQSKDLMNSFKKSGIPLDIRFMDIVSDSGLYKAATAAEPYDQSQAPLIDGLSYYINNNGVKDGYETNGHMASIQKVKNLTIEGVGDNAAIDGWGISFRCGASGDYGKNIEIRNLTFMNTCEDAIAMDGDSKNNMFVEEKVMEHCWIHNNSFYCPHLLYSSDSYDNDKFEGDGSIDFKWVRNMTVDYNYFYQTHKTSLIGGADTNHAYNLTYHHNYFDNCGSRMPLVRHANMHIYNNWYSKVTGQTIDARASAYILSEANIFDSSAAPKVQSNAVIKSLGDYFNSTKTTGVTIVGDRSESVSNSCSYNGITYYDFDNDKSQSYIPLENYGLISEETAIKEKVARYAGVLKSDASWDGSDPVRPQMEDGSYAPETDSDPEEENTENEGTPVSVSIDQIIEASVSQDGIELGIRAKGYYYFNADKVKPEIVVTASDGTCLAAGRDYKVSYKNNKDASMHCTGYDDQGYPIFERDEKKAIENPLTARKAPQIIISFKGNYKNLPKQVIYFDIYPVNINDPVYGLTLTTAAKRDGSITAKTDKSFKFYKKAVLYLTNNKGKQVKKSLGKKDIDIATVTMLSAEGNAYTAADNTAAPAGSYRIRVSGQGNYYGYSIKEGFSLIRK